MESQNKFHEINQGFIQQIQSLREIIPFIMIFINANKLKAKDDYVEFVQKHGKKEEDDQGEKFYTFSPENSHYVSALEENAKIASTASDIIPCSLFVSLISQFDSFLGKLIKEIFRVKPEILNSSDKKLSFSKLKEINDLEEAKDYIIESEVESILRESHSDHFIWLEDKLNMTLRKDFPIWSNFIEITERRNLYVHCDGNVSSQYLLNCRKNGAFKESEPKAGEKLQVNPEYFENSYRTLFEVSVKLSQVIWRKLLPDDLKKADESLNDICFDLMVSHQYNLADNLLYFANDTLKRHFNEEFKNIFTVNKALSLKLGGNKQTAEEIVFTKDWSACSDKFKIARWALLDNFEEVGKLMRKIGPDGEIKKVSYKTWPLFQEFRKTKIFVDCYKDIFKEDFVLLETPKKLFDHFLHDVKELKKKRISAQSKQDQAKISTVSFIEISNNYFPNYKFIPYKVDSFIQEILAMNPIFNSVEFEKALKDNIIPVKQFNKELIVQNPTQYLNPYTMIRHCIYLSNKVLFSKILYDVQQKSFESWIIQQKNN